MRLGLIEQGDRAVQSVDEVVAEIGDDAAERVGDAGPGRHEHLAAGRVRGRAPQACSGPAPPKANRAKSRGSWPRAIDTMRIAPAIFILPSRSTAPAASLPSRPVARPILSAKMARTASTPTGSATASSLPGCSRPSTRLASVMVGSTPAAAVADRSGPGAGALRADLDQARRVDAGDRAAAGADRVHVDHRHVDRHGVLDLGLVGDRRLGVADQRHVGRGAAHVVGDEVGIAGAPAGVGGGDHARGRAGHHGLGRLAGDEARRDHAAVAVHDEEVAAVAEPFQLAAQAGDVAFEDRLHRGVDRRGDAALELARFRQQRMAGGDVAVRPEFGGNLGRAALVRRIGVGVEEVDDEGLATLVEQGGDGGADAFLVERLAHRARGLHALPDLEPEVARDHRHEAAGHAVGLRPRPPAELDDVAKTLRGDHARAGEAAFEDGVRRRRRAVHDEVDVGRRCSRLGERGDDAVRLVVGRRRRLGDAHPAVASVDQDQVGEGAADVDPRHHGTGAFVLPHAHFPISAT